MVKKPSTRHSKSGREPVTIDLDASEAKIAASTGDGGPFEGSPSGSASSFTQTEGTDLSGHPQRGPATRAGEVYSGAETETEAVGEGAEPSPAEPLLGDEALVDTHAGSPILHLDDDLSERDAPAQSTTEMLHADRSPDGPLEDRDAEAAEDAPLETAATDTHNPYETPASFDEPDYEKPPVHPTAVPPVTPEPAAPVRRGASFGSLLAAGLVGGALALGGSMLLGSGLRDNDAPISGGASPAELDALRAEVGGLRSARDNAPVSAGNADVSAEIEQLRTQLAALQQGDGTAASGDGSAAALSSRIDELAAQVQQLAQTGGAGPDASGGQAVDLQPLNSRIAALEQSLQAASQSGNAGEQHLAELQQSVSALSQRVEERANDPRLALAITASALKAAIDRGQPFQTEFDAYVAAAPNAPEADTLRGMAATGVPTRAEIASELPTATSAMVAAGKTEPENAGVVSRLWSSATDLVEVRPVGANVQGNEPGAIVARLEAAVQSGDYPKAIAEYDALPAGSKAAGAEFIAKIRARQAADDLVGKALAEALKA